MNQFSLKNRIPKYFFQTVYRTCKKSYNASTIVKALLCNFIGKIIDPFILKMLIFFLFNVDILYFQYKNNRNRKKNHSFFFFNFSSPH